MTAIVAAVHPTLSLRDDQDPFGKLRVGQSIEARVESIGDAGRACLRVAGMALNVDVPVKLLQGQTVNLVVKSNSNGSLKLELKHTSSAEPAMLSTPPLGSFPNSAFKERGLLNALLDMSAALIAAPPGSSNSVGGKSFSAGIADHGTTLSAGNGTEPSIRTSQGPPTDAVHFGPLDKVAHSQSIPSTNDSDELPRSIEAHNEAARQALATPDRNAASSTTVINYVVPGTADRLQIEVTGDDEGPNRNHRVEAGKSTMASFTVNSADLGQIHVVVRQHGAAISVGFWAERPEVAAVLRNDRGELFDVLDGAVVAVEDIEVFVGAPPVASSRFKIPEANSAK